MERHKRTHSGEKPYRCETCQQVCETLLPLKLPVRLQVTKAGVFTLLQYFSRTDRLLKHKRTCGEAMRKGLDPGMMDLGCMDMGQGSYGITQGNAGSSGRKKGRSKSSGEGGERKKKKGDGGARELHMNGGYGSHEYSLENQTVSSSTELGPSVQQCHHAPKMAFKKANRKSLDKAGLGPAKAGLLDQTGGLEGLGLMQGSEVKVVSTSSNYDDAMQFLKKRRYLQAANHTNASGHGPAGAAGADYDVSVHLSSQPAVIQGGISNVMDADAPLSLDKSGIPDEVLQSLLDYSQKADGSHHDIHFDMSDQAVGLTPASAEGPGISSSTDGPATSGDKTLLMQEYSRFLLQALERTSHSSSFSLGPGLPPSGPFTSSHPGNPLLADKNIYTLSTLECGFGPPASSPSLTSSVPKSHFAMLTGSSPQHGFHLSGLEASTHQQLTPSQELSEQMEKQQQHVPTPPSSYQISPSDLSQKDQPAAKSGPAAVYPLQDLASLDSSKPSYQIENFAQAFGSQFKSDSHGLSYGADSSGDLDHRIRTPVSEFSGYSSLLSDVNEPVSSGSTTPTSQSYR